MKKAGKRMAATCLILTLILMAAGCGKNFNAKTKENSSTEAPGITTESTAQEQDPDLGSSVDAPGSTVHGVRGETENAADGAVGDAVKDAARGVGKAADDIADGLGDAVDNLGGGAFDSYEEARDYLMNKLGKDNASAHYELRKEKKDLVSYNDNDKEAQGYEYHVYETDGNEKIGHYYVDKETGKIYRYMGRNSIEAY